MDGVVAPPSRELHTCVSVRAEVFSWTDIGTNCKLVSPLVRDPPFFYMVLVYMARGRW